MIQKPPDPQQTMGFSLKQLVKYEDIWVLPEYMSYYRYTNYIELWYPVRQLDMIVVSKAYYHASLMPQILEARGRRVHYCTYHLMEGPEELLQYVPKQFHLLLDEAPKEIYWESIDEAHKKA